MIHTKTQQQVSGGSSLQRYQQTIVGSRSVWFTVYFELCAWCGAVPGALGLLLRQLLWPRLFGACGHGVRFGSGIVLRHPQRIRLGDNVVISEGCVLDARHPGVETALSLGDDCVLSNAVVINCKSGTVSIGRRAGIGVQTVIQSVNDCPVSLGEDVIIGPRCYIVGGANYHYDRLDIPVNQQGICPDSGCRVADNVWIGANSSLLGGADIASGAVVAAHSLVKGQVSANRIVGGVPAKEIGNRESSGKAVVEVSGNISQNQSEP